MTIKQTYTLSVDRKIRTPSGIRLQNRAALIMPIYRDEIRSKYSYQNKLRCGTTENWLSDACHLIAFLSLKSFLTFLKDTLRTINYIILPFLDFLTILGFLKTTYRK